MKITVRIKDLKKIITLIMIIAIFFAMTEIKKSTGSVSLCNINISGVEN